MTKQQLKDLLSRAADATRDYASAIDNQLYKCGGYYNAEKERETYSLANELELAVADIDETFVEVEEVPCSLQPS